MKSLWLPREMVCAPRLDPSIRPGPPQPRTALLINPFYKKDPHRLTATVWRPLVEGTRQRHLRFRRRLEAMAMTSNEHHEMPSTRRITPNLRAGSIVAAGV